MVTGGFDEMSLLLGLIGVDVEGGVRLGGFLFKLKGGIPLGRFI